jgi:hypothetical protein
MEKPNINVKQNLNIEVNCPCPKCDTGHLIPFLKIVPTRIGSYGDPDTDYEIFYRCSNCNYAVESDSFF